MSNFLTNLVARSFAPAPDSLRPKLPSLFEAPAGGGPVLEDSPGMQAREEMSEAALVSSTVHRPRLKKHSVRENERGMDDQAESNREAPASHRVAAQTILPFEEPPRAPVRMQNEEHLSTVQTVRVETHSEERKQADSPRLEAAISSSGENDKAGSVQESKSRLVPMIPKLESHHSIPQTENSMDAKKFPSEDRSPTVRINIGRIEVRAVTQPFPPARPSTHQRPKMSLDEYLHRRNEGKR